jgi:hypothetical protein
MKKRNPAAARDGSEVGVASEPWTRSDDFTPIRSDLKPGDRYLLHTTDSGEEYEVPARPYWEHLSVTVEVIKVGRRYLVERCWTANVVAGPPHGEQRRITPRSRGWRFEAHVPPWSSSWVRRREVP